MRFTIVTLGACISAAIASGAGVDSYVQTNLSSDLPGVALNQDPDLVNPWGIVAGPTSPFWINDNGTGLSTIYNGAGAKIPLSVTVPPPGGSAGTSAPTGIVFNGTAGFAGSHFIFDTEDGTISAWSGGTAAALEVTSAKGSVYKGLALGTAPGNSLLYATNFGLDRVDVFNSNFKSVTVSGGFKDSAIPAGYAPFDIQNINGDLYVTYAKQDGAHHDDVAGPGNGYIDVFDMNGNLLRRLVSKGALNSPWGLALAPSTFGDFSNDLLVGNFGNGWINAYNATTGAFEGTLDDTHGHPVAIKGLWGLDFGNGADGQGVDSLYFTAGIPGSGSIEDHGLYGSLTATPEPGSSAMLGLAGIALIGFSLMKGKSVSKAA